MGGQFGGWEFALWLPRKTGASSGRNKSQRQRRGAGTERIEWRERGKDDVSDARAQSRFHARPNDLY